jgi:transposase
MFVPLVHPPGDAQADFGEAVVVIAGVERKAHYLAMDLPQSDDCFVMAVAPLDPTALITGSGGRVVKVKLADVAVPAEFPDRTS